MTFSVGDILRIDAPIADHKKYHICLGQNEYVVTLCLFLNSENRFEGNLEVDGARLPMLPPSRTGKSTISFGMIPRYTDAQLAKFGAVKLGELAKDLAQEVADACAKCKTLTASEKRFVIDRLHAYATS